MWQPCIGGQATTLCGVFARPCNYIIQVPVPKGKRLSEIRLILPPNSLNFLRNPTGSCLSKCSVLYLTKTLCLLQIYGRKGRVGIIFVLLSQEQSVVAPFFQCLNPTLARWCPEIVEHQHRSLSVGTIRPAPTFREQWVACCSRARWPTGATEILANHPVAGLTVLRIAQKSQKSDPARCWARPTKTLAHKAKNHSILDNVEEN